MNNPEQKFPLWKNIFMVLGMIFTVILVLIIGGLIALIVIKPYGIDVTAPFKTNDTVPYDHPLLTPQQEKDLQSVGIDPAIIPTSITSAQKQCAITLIGAKRVEELLAGATPTAAEIFKLKDCR